MAGHVIFWNSLPRILLLFVLCLLRLPRTLAQPAAIKFTDCFTGNTSIKLDVSTVYAQVLLVNEQRKLNFTVIGTTPQEIIEASDSLDPVATTLFTTTEQLTFNVWTYNSYFCSTLRPASPLPDANSQGGYCPLSAGPFALSSSIILPTHYELVTFDTRLRALDPSENELLCLDLSTTTLAPGPLDSVYGHARIIFWTTVALSIAYWMVVGLARIASAWSRGSTRSGPGLWARVESVGFILASAISGERLATSPALMRFCTPSLRDIIFHTQWCAALAMVAVQWPDFIYPLLSQTAWSTLIYNITLSQGAEAAQDHWYPLTVQPYDPPSNFADQLQNISSPIYINDTAPNILFQLPPNTTSGIASFAWAVGIRPQDLFGICLSLFLAIIAATIVLSISVWAVDWIATLLDRAITGGISSSSGITGSRSPRYSSASKDMLDSSAVPPLEENRSTNFMLRGPSRFPNTGIHWWRLRPGFVSFHSSVLQGNIIRILIWFHLPVTIFSCYQMTLGRSHATLASIILAAISFVIFSVLLPILLILRLTFTNTTKLYDETWTLLSLGPLYNHYRHGSQLFAVLLFASNLAFGVTIGCGQKSGTAQAIIILVIEVVSALWTSVWLPWGQGASMGLISFLFCVARIVIAVLLVILTPIVSVSPGPAQWVAYAILVILALIYLALLLMLVVKIIEAVIRILTGVGFHRSRHVVDSGLLGTLSLAGCCGSRNPNRAKQRTADLASQPTLPLTRPNLPFKDDTPTHSAPPSVLRPEHALQPYKEDSDDETGYIMGAWQPFPGPGYSPVDDQLRTPEQSTSSSGFRRVGGGRAHFDSPYAITSGSTQTFPSVERPVIIANSQTTNDYSPPPTPSIASAVRRTEVNLPPGAMPPPHIRTKSQTAIIEDAAALKATAAVAGASELAAEGRNDDAGQPKKKHWFKLRAGRGRHNSEEAVPQEAPLVEEPGRSFVVVRKPQPGAPGERRSSSALR